MNNQIPYACQHCKTISIVLNRACQHMLFNKSNGIAFCRVPVYRIYSLFPHAIATVCRIWCACFCLHICGQISIHFLFSKLNVVKLIFATKKIQVVIAIDHKPLKREAYQQVLKTHLPLTFAHENYTAKCITRKAFGELLNWSLSFFA